MKRIAMIFVLLCFLAGSLTAQEQFPDLKAYANAYVAQFGLTNVNWNRPPEMYETDPVENAKYATLRGNSQYLDTPFEIALYAYYSPKADAAPPEAEAILPHSNPRLVDRQLGAAVFQEIQILRFLADTAAVNRHEAVLQFITGRGNATRAEIEAFYRNNVRAQIAAVVDERVNTVSDFIGSLASAYFNFGTLTYNPNTSLFTFKYEFGDRKGEFTAGSYSDMYPNIRNSRHFDDDGLYSITAMFFQIPNANTYNNTRIAVSRMVTEPIINFYLTPNQANLDQIKNIIQMLSSNDFITAANLQSDIDRSENLAQVYERLGDREAARISRQGIPQSTLPRFVSRYGVTNVTNVTWGVISRLISEVFSELDTTTNKSLSRMLR